MRKLHEHTTRTAADALGEVEVGILPVGSVEQHGPALPLGTDLFAAEGVASQVEREDAMVLPSVPVGVSAHHHQFHGTLSASDATYEAYVRDILVSLAGHGVQKVVVVNGHGGNTGALTRAARTLRDDGTLFAVPWEWWANLDDLIEARLDTSLGHADEVETSAMLHLTELVREDYLEDAEAGAASAWGKRVPGGADVGFDTADFSESGAVGHPTQGSAEVGKELVEESVADLNALVDWLAAQDFENLLPADHR